MNKDFPSNVRPGEYSKIPGSRVSGLHGPFFVRIADQRTLDELETLHRIRLVCENLEPSALEQALVFWRSRVGAALKIGAPKWLQFEQGYEIPVPILRRDHESGQLQFLAEVGSAAAMLEARSRLCPVLITQ